jgi:hypothetical protein
MRSIQQRSYHPVATFDAGAFAESVCDLDGVAGVEVTVRTEVEEDSDVG